MNANRPDPQPLAANKARSGIAGFDDMTGGGLPSGRTSLLVGGPGAGKTIFALQFLVHGAKVDAEPGIFVAFEETSSRIKKNIEGFGWGTGRAGLGKLVFVDAQPDPDLVQSGSFDMGGLLSVLEMHAAAIGAKRIVFDALDILLMLLPDAAAQRREVYRLHAWLLDKGFTGLITAKAGADGGGADSPRPFGYMQFMVDCAVLLDHRVVQGVSQRNLRVQKYRGSSFEENEAPFVISKDGFDVAISRSLGAADAKVSNERVSTGVERLDTMLGGGYFRAATVLITGFPGTAKTTLSGAFAEAACVRKERTLFVSFDSDGAEIIRNLSSVGIRLAPHVRSGVLRMVSARTITGSAETFLVRIKTLATEQRARCVVIDPVSMLSKTGRNELTAHGVAERLIDWSKSAGITMVCTSLLDEMSSQLESSSGTQVSTLADTWIHLNYLVQSGERNRGIAIIKSRGTAHSNQVRELVLSSSGLTLADVYSAGGEVLMGTMRWEKESAERLAAEIAEVARSLKGLTLDAQEAELVARMKALQTELAAKKAEKTLLERTTESRKKELSRGRSRNLELRGADDPPLSRK